MPVAHHREREVTFDVDEEWSIPALASLVPDGGRVVEQTHTLQATYLDTERSTLRALGFTLRRRTGGDDAGWHLKIPAGEARTEVHSRASGTALPGALARRIAGVVGDQPVRVVATIRTTRHTSRVLTGEGELVLEVADDRVTGARPGDSGEVTWREVQVELGPAGTERDLERAGDLFTGARVASVQRKVNHVLGEPAVREPAGRPGLLAAYLREQCRAVLVGDVRLRDEPTPEAVHTTRVALRRLRSTLRAFSDAVADVPDRLDDDLRWLAGLLSPVRDSDILGRRLDRELGRLADRDVVGPVRAEVERALRERRGEGMRALVAARLDDRYRSVMDTLVQWYATVPVREDARLRPRRTLRKSTRRVRRRLRGAGNAGDLHQARKAAKRLRYAADLLVPGVAGARPTAKRAKRLQTALGELQDLVVTQDFLRSLATSRRVASGFTYGVLVESLDRRRRAKTSQRWRL